MRDLFKRLQARYRYSLILLRQLVITDFKIRYQNSVLGYIWSLLRPLGLFVILYVVFVKFLKVGAAVPHFPVYLLVGIILWNYFSEVTNNSVQMIVGQGPLIRKLSFPRYVMVLAGSVSALINLTLNAVIVSIFMVLNHVELRSTVVLLPLLIFELFIVSIAVAFFLSAAFVKLRDLNYIWEIIMQGAFYATPILYPLSVVENETIQKILLLNPAAQIIQDVRYVLVTDQTITTGSVFSNQLFRMIPFVITAAAFIFGSMYFRRNSKNFAENV